MTDGPLWGVGEAYEPYVGRWSRLVAREFLAWVDAPADRRWVDVGCGTGALTEAILATQNPASVEGVDPADGFVAFAREHIADPRATFTIGDAQSLPFEAASRDVVVSGLSLNFVPDPQDAVRECRRVLSAGGIAAAYVWDYAGEMQMMRHFWDAAVALDPAALALDEAQRSPICNPDRLTELWRSAGLGNVEVRAIDALTVFADFDDYWTPFLGGRAPAPAYVLSLTEQRRVELRERLRSTLPAADDGRIHLIARAWAIKGRV